MSDPFDVGEKVRLKSGGPLMTVTGYDVPQYHDEKEVYTTWFDSKHERQSDHFPPATLQKVA